MCILDGFSAWALPALFVRAPVTRVTHVVVGVNGTAWSAAALRWAADEAWRRQVRLRVVSAWQQTAQAGLPCAGHPARMAASRAGKALAYAESRHEYVHPVSSAAIQGNPGEILLAEAGQAGLLALGACGYDLARALGPVGRYCVRRGRGPLAFVPASPAGQDGGADHSFIG